MRDQWIHRNASPEVRSVPWPAVAVLVMVAAVAVGCRTSEEESPPVPRFRQGTIASFDGIELAYTMGGEGDRSLVFIHGWLGDRTHWTGQLEGLSDQFVVVSLDLAGHGASGTGRTDWTLEAFGRDVASLVEELELGPVVLVGHDMGALVALEAAWLLPLRVGGVVAVEALHDADPQVSEAQLAAIRARYEQDFVGTCDQYTRMVFPAQAEAGLEDRIVSRMCATPQETALAILDRLWQYEPGPAMARLAVPIRAINGELAPTDVESNRRFDPDFELETMAGVHHFPMLVAPAQLNRRLRDNIAVLPLPEPATPP